MSDLVWIRGTAEVNVAGVDPIEVYESVPRVEWDEWTESERKSFIDSVADDALEQIAGYGASVVDESEVPESER